ncbi:MAG: glucose dehydrogenase, partial [Porticoccaceae bacterium]
MSDRLRFTLIPLLCLILNGCNIETSSLDESTPGNTYDNWAAHGFTSKEQRFSPLTQVNRNSVSELALDWHYEFDTNRGQEATPLAIDGVIYTTTAWSKVFALDGTTGKLLWSYDPKVPGEAAAKGCCDVVNRGAA